MISILLAQTSDAPITKLPATTPTSILWVALGVAVVVAIIAYLTFRK